MKTSIPTSGSDANSPTPRQESSYSREVSARYEHPHRHHQPAATSRPGAISAGSHRRRLSSITAAGLASGVAKGGSERNHRALEKFLAPLEIASFAEAASWCYGTLRADLERAGQPIGSLETLIAAHTLTLRVTMVTNNVSEFARVKGLKVENWV